MTASGVIDVNTRKSGGPVLMVGLLSLTILLSGCVSLEYDPCDDGKAILYKHPPTIRPVDHEAGPTIWQIKCAAELWSVERFRFALTLGDGERFWLEPETGEVANHTPIPTYGYNFGTGRAHELARSSLTTTDLDLVFGFYNWGPHGSGPQETACYVDNNRLRSRDRSICDTPFLAVWNGTETDSSAWDPLPSGRYAIEVYLRDANDTQSLLVVYEIRGDGRAIDWLACDEASEDLALERDCEGTLDEGETLGRSAWPDHEGNQQQQDIRS